MPDENKTEDARISALETAVAELKASVAAISEGLTSGFTARDEKAANFTEAIARIESDLAMLGDRPALEVAPLDANETRHVRAVLARFGSDAPPLAAVSDDT